MAGTTIGVPGVTFPDGTVQSTKATGTVTSVATGGGLTGGTITGSGTISLDVSASSIGTTVLAAWSGSGSSRTSIGTTSAGSNLLIYGPAGAGTYQITVPYATAGQMTSFGLPGTWMATVPAASSNDLTCSTGYRVCTIWKRIS
jgi:hypothetical protein